MSTHNGVYIHEISPESPTLSVKCLICGGTARTVTSYTEVVPCVCDACKNAVLKVRYMEDTGVLEELATKL